MNSSSVRVVLSTRGAGATAARYSVEPLRFPRRKIFRGGGSAPFIWMGKGCLGWTRRGTWMNRGDSGGICPWWAEDVLKLGTLVGKTHFRDRKQQWLLTSRGGMMALNCEVSCLMNWRFQLVDIKHGETFRLARKKLRFEVHTPPLKSINHNSESTML